MCPPILGEATFFFLLSAHPFCLALWSSGHICHGLYPLLLPDLHLSRLPLLHALFSLQITSHEPREDSLPAVFTPFSRLFFNSLGSSSTPTAHLFLCMSLADLHFELVQHFSSIFSDNGFRNSFLIDAPALHHFCFPSSAPSLSGTFCTPSTYKLLPSIFLTVILSSSSLLTSSIASSSHDPPTSPSHLLLRNRPRLGSSPTSTPSPDLLTRAPPTSAPCARNTAF